MAKTFSNPYWLVGVCVAIACASIGWSHHVRDVSIIARGGTIVSALAAIFIVIQASFELEIRGAQAGVGKPQNDDAYSRLSPLQQLAHRIASNRDRLARSVVEKRLLHIVASAALCAALGELQEGFAEEIYSFLSFLFH
jgi:hypothetical protein